MQLSAFGYAVLITLLGAAVTAVVSAVYLIKRKHAYLTDLGTILLPPIAFFLVGRTRSEIQIGFALLIWPILIGAASMYAFGLKAALFDSGAPMAKASSRALFALCIGVAVVLGFLVGPWGE
jgi:hypothetical protein